MKTLEIAAKYSTIIARLLGPDNALVTFLYRGKECDPWKPIGNYYDPDKKEIAVNNWALGFYKLQVRGEDAASWKLYQLPHCCGICVSCNAFVYPTFRSHGLGTILNNLRQELARGLGYSVLMCTDISSNEHQRKLLKTNGWKDIFSFINKRTGNTVAISVVNI